MKYQPFARLKAERTAKVMFAQSTKERIILTALNRDKKRHMVGESGNFIKRQRTFKEAAWVVVRL